MVSGIGVRPTWIEQRVSREYRRVPYIGSNCRLVGSGGEYQYSYHFPKSVAGLGSMLSDVQASAQYRR